LIFPKSSHRREGEVWFQTPVRTGEVRHANVPWMIHIRPSSAKAEGSLTARPTRRAGTKVGLSDPTVPSGRAVAQRIKVTLGITG
ncbi:hypothetical protein HN873_037009, partial [Arachis hypogaea]